MSQPQPGDHSHLREPRVLEPFEFNAEVDQLPGRCFHCHSSRHSQKDCKSNSKLIPICANCRRRGVKIFECPRCKKRHTHYLYEQAYKKELSEGKKPSELWERFPEHFSVPTAENPLDRPHSFIYFLLSPKRLENYYFLFCY